MSGVGLQYTVVDFVELQRRVDAMTHLDTRSLMDSIGTEVESQFRRRIAEEKTTPEGEAWKPWSESYAATRHGGQSLLFSEGHLVDSMTHVNALDGSDVDVGSNLVYAAIQNFGGAEVGKPSLPARTYAGLSAENRQDVLVVASDWLAHHLAGRLQ